jgi:hypothetical protein
MDDGEAVEIDTGAARIFVRRLGSGPPLLLLHGFVERPGPMTSKAARSALSSGSVPELDRAPSPN